MVSHDLTLVNHRFPPLQPGPSLRSGPSPPHNFNQSWSHPHPPSEMSIEEEMAMPQWGLVDYDDDDTGESKHTGDETPRDVTDVTEHITPVRSPQLRSHSSSPRNYGTDADEPLSAQQKPPKIKPATQPAPRATPTPGQRPPTARMVLLTDGTVACMHCYVRFSHISKLADHLQEVHTFVHQEKKPKKVSTAVLPAQGRPSPKTKNPWCSRCGEVFPAYSSLQKHFDEVGHRTIRNSKNTRAHGRPPPPPPPPKPQLDDLSWW